MVYVVVIATQISLYPVGWQENITAQSVATYTVDEKTGSMMTDTFVSEANSKLKAQSSIGKGGRLSC